MRTIQPDEKREDSRVNITFTPSCDWEPCDWFLLLSDAAQPAENEQTSTNFL